jgi:hypothetical protein
MQLLFITIEFLFMCFISFILNILQFIFYKLLNYIMEILSNELFLPNNFELLKHNIFFMNEDQELNVQMYPYQVIFNLFILII